VSAGSLTITSAHQGTQVRIEPDPGAEDHWYVALTAPALSASLRFWCYQGTGLGVYFGELAEHWWGWTGERTWATIEGDLAFGATHDGTGHITLVVELAVGWQPAWSCSAALELEPGMLNGLARQARSIG
jgi:hypothetical protein